MEKIDVFGERTSGNKGATEDLALKRTQGARWKKSKAKETMMKERNKRDSSRGGKKRARKEGRKEGRDPERKADSLRDRR